MRNGVESPTQISSAHIEGANVAGWRWMGFGIAPSHNNEIFVDHAWTGHCDGLRLIIAAQVFSKIDPAVFSEVRHWFARSGVQRIQKIGDRGEDATLLAIGPIRHAANRILTLNARLKFPYQLAGGGIEGDHFLGRGVAIENAPDDDRTRLQATFFVGI